MTGSRDPGTTGVSCLCLTHILFIILFCRGERKFAQAKDFFPLIISELAQDYKLCKITDCSSQTFKGLLIPELLHQGAFKDSFRFDVVEIVWEKNNTFNLNTLNITFNYIIF